MDLCEKQRTKVFKFLPNLGVPMALPCVNRAHGTRNFHFQASSQHDSMRHRKIRIGQKIIQLRIHLTGNFEFSESSKLSL